MFDNRLAILRKKCGMSRKDAANALKIPYTTYLNYENDIREPNADTLIKIAKLYDVSIDYLLGVSDVKTTKREDKYEEMKKDKITITIEEYKEYLKATEQLNMLKNLLLGNKKNSYYDLKEMAIAVFGVSVGDNNE